MCFEQAKRTDSRRNEISNSATYVTFIAILSIAMVTSCVAMLMVATTAAATATMTTTAAAAVTTFLAIQSAKCCWNTDIKV